MRGPAQLLGVFLTLLFTVSVSGQVPADFTGHWRQQTNSGTQRQLDVEQHGRSLLVKTIITNSRGTRSLEVSYEIGGPGTTYKGLDGDEFRSSVRWDGSALFFDTIEHEGESDIPQKATWTLSPDRSTLQVERQSTKSGRTTPSLTTYVRQP